MFERSRILVALSGLTATIALCIGIAYLTDDELSRADVLSPGAGAGLYLATLAFLGASALFAAGTWQRAAVSRMRVIVLFGLAALAGTFVAANSLAILASTSGPPGRSGSGLPGAPRGLHWAGLAIGAGLYLAALVEATLAIRDERRVSPA